MTNAPATYVVASVTLRTTATGRTPVALEVVATAVVTSAMTNWLALQKGALLVGHSDIVRRPAPATIVYRTKIETGFQKLKRVTSILCDMRQRYDEGSNSASMTPRYLSCVLQLTVQHWVTKPHLLQE